jgi:hypothetical protein
MRPASQPNRTYKLTFFKNELKTVQFNSNLNAVNKIYFYDFSLDFNFI